MGLEDSHEMFARSQMHEKTIQVILENTLMMPGDASQEAKAAELASESYKLRKAFLNLVKDRCKARGVAPESREALELFDEANNTASSIIYAYQGLPLDLEQRAKLSPVEVKEKMALLIPYPEDVVSYAKRLGRFGAPSEFLSLATGDYVKNRFKSAEIDWILIQALTQAEIVANCSDLYYRNPITWTSRADYHKPISVRRFLWNMSKVIFWLWLAGGSIAASPLAFATLPPEVMLFIGLAVGGFGTIALLVVGVSLVIDVIEKQQRYLKYRQSITDLCVRLDVFFREFRGAGPFSLSHFKKRVNQLADEGMIWPSGLFVLIDDMESRSDKSS